MNNTEAIEIDAMSPEDLREALREQLDNLNRLRSRLKHMHKTAIKFSREDDRSETTRDMWEMRGMGVENSLQAVNRIYGSE